MSALSIASLAFSLVALILALHVWRTVGTKMRVATQLDAKVDEAVQRLEAATDKKLENITNEVRGRTLAILGYIIGELSVDDEEQPEEPTDAERLQEAIYYCRKAYEFLKDSGIPTEYMALNNMLQYSCILGIAGDTPEDRDVILEEARRLRAAAEEHDSPNLLLTYARTILKFGVEPQELEQACSIVASIRSHPDHLNEKQKREAELLTVLCQQRITKPDQIDAFADHRTSEGTSPCTPNATSSSG